MEKLTIRLPPATMASLRQQARKNGRSVQEEIPRAVDAYLLGTSPSEHEMLKALSDKFEELVKKYKRTQNQALHKSGHRKNAPAYPADDGPLSADQINQIKQISSQAKASKDKVRSSLIRSLSRRAVQSKRSGSG